MPILNRSIQGSFIHHFTTQGCASCLFMSHKKYKFCVEIQYFREVESRSCAFLTWILCRPRRTRRRVHEPDRTAAVWTQRESLFWKKHKRDSSSQSVFLHSDKHVVESLHNFISSYSLFLFAVSFNSNAAIPQLLLAELVLVHISRCYNI